LNVHVVGFIRSFYSSIENCPGWTRTWTHLQLGRNQQPALIKH